MGDLTKNFSRAEFACKCGCGYDDIDEDLVKLLQGLRNWWRRPVRINSGCRCAEHNADVGGAPASKHVLGIAADVTVDGIPPEEVYRWLECLLGEAGGLGKYETFTHVDVRANGPARW